MPSSTSIWEFGTTTNDTTSTVFFIVEYSSPYRTHLSDFQYNVDGVTVIVGSSHISFTCLRIIPTTSDPVDSFSPIDISYAITRFPDRVFIFVCSSRPNPYSTNVCSFNAASCDTVTGKPFNRFSIKFIVSLSPFDVSS